ncbi:DNA replication ATP-dependent helicase/nuclease DNA2 isoform X2 [Poecilia reticulata]|uniref:DNA replication ATP-dependent helicase/nuclease DNA2 isoform X2 n=1 Tax=Poecilia reticulata TaxID=8081 RepID=UPI0004A37BC1|nr:PREDICTED: DNA replication ATP-dependent helicase/nuclease DNA2 isoform X2 [Poecilia reticulata]
MNRNKMKKTKVTTGLVGGQQNISSFFCSKNQKVLPPTSKAEPQIKEIKFRLSTPPPRRSILSDLENLGDLENRLASSPDVLLSVPETPSSQIRPSCSSPSRRASQLRSDPKLCQRSPVCRSPSTKSIRVGRIMTEEGEVNKSANRLSGPFKRLFSPSEESQNAKKPRTSPLKAWIGSTVTPLLTAGLTDLSLGGDGKRQQQQQQQEKTDSCFTVMTEVEGFLEEDTCTPAAPLPEQSAQELEVVPKERMATRETHRDGNNKTPSDQEQGGDAESGPADPSEDGFEESWFTDQMDDNEATEEKSKKHLKVPDHVILSEGPNNRYLVLKVEEKPGHKSLTISGCRSLLPTETCLLKDGWESTPVCRGDVVHLEGRSEGGAWLVDRERGFLVLQPDSLISGTSISNSIRCMRRAVLGEMFKSFDGGSKQMLNGTMVHEVFQRAASAKDFSLQKLSQLADEALRNHRYLGNMFALGVSQEEMQQELHDYLPSLEHWANEYLCSPAPKPISSKMCQAPPAVFTLTELADIEENVWSPRFGLKGKMDVTAKVRMQRSRNGSSRVCEEKTVPLELKTGRESNSIEHRSQVILYTLMSMERYSPEIGLLLYLKTGNMHPVAAGHMDHRELLKLRNSLVHHINHSVEKGADRSRLSRLPDILSSRQTCQYCPQKLNCALYERVVDSTSVDVGEDEVRAFLQQETSHLTHPHLDYFAHWLLLCSLEASTMEAKSGRKRVWLQSVLESEKGGSCVGNLQLSGSAIAQSEGVFVHHFLRSAAASQQGANNCGLTSGDRIVVSDQEGRLIGLATGYLKGVNATSVSCTLDRDLSKFSGVSFRLDSDEGVVGLSTHLSNLSRLMESSGDSERLRELVVDLRPPEFITNLSSVLPREAKDTVANILKGLNKPQKQAMKKVLLSKDFTLIVGMPGTGKTTTICTLVRILHACGFSVLLTSYTHSAVDNILLKLKRFRVGFLRLGQGQKVHPEILPYTEESVRRKDVHTLTELQQLYSKELVVATTCMGIKHPIFTRRRFDFCIVDEASQISQPICLGPLFYAKRFVLVGDHQQLPPIVQNQEARSLGMDESLFKRLELHSEAVVQLNVQYRMNSQIMSLSNSLMYDGRLECGSERTASALLTLPSLPSVQSELTSCSETRPQLDLSWLQAALLPSNPVCFLDCSAVPALESVEQGGVSNRTEAALIHMMLSLLIKAGCKPGDIGVIAPYRQQLKCISALLQSSAFSGVEVNTVDRYQGRDKNLIVLSFVRSTAEEGNLGELLKDWRRLNVAVTRAKHKLLMVGSAATLRRYPPVEKLLQHLLQQNMIIQLPPAAHKALPSMHL